MTTLEDIIATGNRGHWHQGDRSKRLFSMPAIPNHIECVDGFTVSVIAGAGTYCEPRPAFCMFGYDIDGAETSCTKHDEPLVGGNHPCNYEGPYTHVEVGMPSEAPEPWEIWSEFVEDADEPTDTVYARVPVEDVRDLIALHGGEVDE